MRSPQERRRVLKRDVTVEECRWLDRTYKAGETVYLYSGATYGVIGPNGTAVTEVVDETPFFELPCDALGKPVVGAISSADLIRNTDTPEIRGAISDRPGRSA